VNLSTELTGWVPRPLDAELNDYLPLNQAMLLAQRQRLINGVTQG